MQVKKAFPKGQEPPGSRGGRAWDRDGRGGYGGYGGYGGRGDYRGGGGNWGGPADSRMYNPMYNAMYQARLVFASIRMRLQVIIRFLGVKRRAEAAAAATGGTTAAAAEGGIGGRRMITATGAGRVAGTAAAREGATAVTVVTAVKAVATAAAAAAAAAMEAKAATADTRVEAGRTAAIAQRLQGALLPTADTVPTSAAQLRCRRPRRRDTTHIVERCGAETAGGWGVCHERMLPFLHVGGVKATTSHQITFGDAVTLVQICRSSNLTVVQIWFVMTQKLRTPVKLVTFYKSQ